MFIFLAWYKPEEKCPGLEEQLSHPQHEANLCGSKCSFRSHPLPARGRRKGRRGTGPFLLQGQDPAVAHATSHQLGGHIPLQRKLGSHPSWQADAQGKPRSPDIEGQENG